MRKWIFGGLVCGMVVMHPMTSFAADMPSWVNGLIDLGLSYDKLSNIILSAIKIAGVISGVLTAIAAMLDALKVALAGVSRAAGFSAVADKIESYINMVQPYVKWFSMYNVQKSQSIESK